MSNTFSRLLIAAAPSVFVVLWGSGFVVARLSAPHVDPFTFLAIRFPIAAAILAVIAGLAGAPWPGGRLAVHAAIAGILMHTLYLAPVYWSVAHGMPAGVAALIIGLQPLLTALMAGAMVQEPISLRHWLGLLIGILGVALVVLPKLSPGLLGGITPVTTLVTLVGAIGISLGTVYQKKFATGLHIASGGVWQYLGAGLTSAMLALAFEDLRFDGTVNAWLALAWSVVVLSLGAITLLMMLIRQGAVAQVASLIYLVPAVAAMMAYVLYDETLTATQLVGMAVCAAGVLIVNRQPSRQR
jgi:drug/metabolite transporter (DMT)-like permease